ncbi:MAG: FAD-dependent oxidoreductase [Rhizobiaceae bacterium]
MRNSPSTLHGRKFDVIVIGGGINGCSAAQTLAASGFDCLLVDKGDFGSGASGRSSRMLHIGLRFFEARKPVLHFGLHPGRFLNALRGARQAMQAVGEHLQNAGDRIWPYRMCFPIYHGDEFRAWHVKAGMHLLKHLGGGRVALDHETVNQNHSAKVPFFHDFRNTEQIQSLALYNEFKFDWPERFCMDMALDAERNGATLLNYCSAYVSERDAAGDWSISLHDQLQPTDDTVSVRAPIILNMAGTWIDEVLPDTGRTKKLIHATKGSHLVVEMPDTYRGFGIAALNSLGLPFYVLPLHGNLFSIGVTETPFEGDATDVAVTDDEIDFLIAETNALLPGRKLTRADVLRTWAGVRPLTATNDETKEGRAPPKLHDLKDRDLPGVFALTGGPIMTHRSAGRTALDAVTSLVSPSGQTGPIDHTPYAYSESGNSPAFLADQPDIRVADIELAATREHGTSLADILLRRTGLAWRRNLTEAEVKRAAEIIGPHLNWSQPEADVQIADFMRFQRTMFRAPGETRLKE